MNAVKIYFGERLLLLTNNEGIKNSDSEIVLYDPTEIDIANLVEQIQTGSVEYAMIKSGDMDALLNKIRNQFKVIKAGGGIVINKNEDVLLIFRRGKWDLPKGKLDEGETLEECALREVSEETGLTQITSRKFFGITWHVYKEKDQLVLKETYWYLMDHVGTENLVPQIDEDIEKAEWVATEKLSAYLNNTFPSIKDILMNWKG